MTSYPVKGDVVEIVRAGGETRIVVDDGLSGPPPGLASPHLGRPSLPVCTCVGGSCSQLVCFLRPSGLSQEPKIVLSEAMIEFGSALEYEEYDRAASILESLEQTAEVETMWRNLATAALKNTKLLTAERWVFRAQADSHGDAAPHIHVCLHTYIHAYLLANLHTITHMHISITTYIT